MKRRTSPERIASRVNAMGAGILQSAIGCLLKKENTEDRWRDVGPTVSKTARQVNSSYLASAKKIVESARQP